MKLDGIQLWQELERARQESILPLQSYHKIDQTFNASQIIQEIDAILARRSRTFKLGIVGEFKSGKSSLINALAESDMALVDELETTASLNMYGYAEQASAAIIYQDGTRDEMSPAAVNGLLDERRFDVEWLRQIKTVETRGPSPALKRIELWDTPGLGGAQFNSELAQRFLREVDAVIWVFDCNYLGKASLNETLQELRDRGKHIIGVVNKCEERTEEELPRVKALVERSYSSINFQRIMPFSALMVKEFQSGVPESSFYGDLPPDGGLSDLRQALEVEIMSDPQQISAAAAAGDLRSLLSAAADRAHQTRLAARRALWLLEDQTRKVDEELVRLTTELTDEFTDELTVEIRESFIQNIHSRLEKARLSQLQDPEWIKDQINNATQGDVSAISAAFLKKREHRVVAAIQQMISNRTDDLYRSLVPQEVGTYFTEISLNQVSGLLGEDTTSATPWQTTLGWGTSALMFSFFLPVGWLILLFSGGVAFLSRFLNEIVTDNAEDRHRKLLADRRKACENAIYEATEAEKPRLKKAVQQVMDDVNERIRTIVLGKSEERILRGTSRMDLQRAANEGELVVAQLNQICVDLARAAGIASQTKAALLRAPAIIPQGDQQRAMEFFKALVAEGADRVEITDGRLDYRVLSNLLGVSEMTSLRIIAWEQPLSPGLAEPFSQALHKLEESRAGSVSVVCPKASSEQQTDERPLNCWFFTLGGAYEFSGTLGEILSANREITFTPHDDTGELKENKFQRWWDDKVSGYQAIRIN